MQKEVKPLPRKKLLRRHKVARLVAAPFIYLVLQFLWLILLIVGAPIFATAKLLTPPRKPTPEQEFHP